MPTFLNYSQHAVIGVVLTEKLTTPFCDKSFFPHAIYEEQRNDIRSRIEEKINHLFTTTRLGIPVTSNRSN
jgi:hypothetical protein